MKSLWEELRPPPRRIAAFSFFINHQFGPASQVMKAMQHQAQAMVGEKAA